METSNMKPNEPSRTALLIARQRAAHQVLDHGSILYDPFASRFCAKTKRTCCNLRTDTPWPASDVCSPPHEAGLRRMLCKEPSKEGFGRSSSLAPDLTLSLSGVPMAHARSISMRWTTPPHRHGNASV